MINEVKVSRDFKGIWIPKDIWLHPELNCIEKCMAAEIDSLDCEDGCFASNEHFMKFMGLKESTIRAIISKLKKLGLVEIISFNGRKRYLRGYSKIARSGLPAKKLAGRTAENQRSRTKNIHIHENKEEKKESTQASVAHSRLSLLLFEKILEIDPKHEKPNFTKWDSEIEKIMRIMKRSEQEIEQVIEWTYNNNFWSRKVLSTSKLRKQYETLFVEMMKDKEKEVKSAGGSGTSSETADRIRDNKALAVKILGDKVKEYKFPIKIGDGALSIKGERGFSVLGYQEFGFKDRLENVMRKLGVVWV